MEKTKKFYSQKVITIATYFESPLAAVFLIQKNYETLEQNTNGKIALFISIIIYHIALYGNILYSYGDSLM